MILVINIILYKNILIYLFNFFFFKKKKKKKKEKEKVKMDKIIENNKPHIKKFPDANGYFGKYGGSFVSEELQKEMENINKAYNTICRSQDFIHELRHIRKHFQGRPTPVYYCKNLSDLIGGARIYLKREGKVFINKYIYIIKQNKIKIFFDIIYIL